jgi:hypothetical protein
MVVEFADVVLKGYEEIMRSITVAEFVRITARSERLGQRKGMESHWRSGQKG